MGREYGLTGTFFCVTTATLSLPLTAMLVFPAAFTALNAYSAGNMHFLEFLHDKYVTYDRP